jgi:hypothetical protein
MLSTGFEPAIATVKLLQTHFFDDAAYGIGVLHNKIHPITGHEGPEVE